jgi:hypothetical protein
VREQLAPVRADKPFKSIGIPGLRGIQDISRCARQTIVPCRDEFADLRGFHL